MVQMLAWCGVSSGETSEQVVPVAPARAVRPERCTYTCQPNHARKQSRINSERIFDCGIYSTHQNSHA